MKGISVSSGTLRLNASYNSLLFRLRFSNFNDNVVNQLEAPFIFAGSFALSCSWLILSWSCCRMVLCRSSLVLTIFLLEPGHALFNIHWCCAVLIVDMFNQLFSGYAEVDKLMASNGRNNRYCQTTFLYWLGEQKSFLGSAYVAICDCWDKYIIHKCI